MKADLKQVHGLGSDFQTIYENWLPLTYALNELNRGMGLQDLYPFVISEKAVSKLQFIHETLRNQGSP